MNGAKIMKMSVLESDIRFIDSLNFLPMPLSKFPKTFGFTELVKGYFPHFFNTEANQHYVGPLADAKYYDPDGMKPEAREAFYKWITHSVRNGSSLAWKKNWLNIADLMWTF